MDNLKIQENKNLLLLQSIFPAAIASCASIVKNNETKIIKIAKTSLFKEKQETVSPLEGLKEKFLATAIGKLLLNPFGYIEVSFDKHD